ncbi:hypothetical protein ABFX02_14G064200 [Erythranthe guttata]
MIIASLVQTLVRGKASFFSGAMLKAPALLSSRYSFTTSFLYSRSSTRRHFRRRFKPPLSPGVALPRASSSFTHNSDQAEMESESYAFGPYKINPSEVFYSTQLSYALVNLRPLLPGKET